MNISGYTIKRRIGTGGQAMVYEAIQDSLQRPVALKVLNPVYAGSEEFTRRFLNEGRILANLGHSHVITIHDIGVVDDLHYLSMELVEGGDLRLRMRAGLTPRMVLDYLAIIADCLATAHAKNIVHRDIKPGNVLFRTDGTLLLTDFGIAKRLDAERDLTLSGTTLGSPHYLSPEQAQNKPLDGRADIYSLGAMAYEMFTGRKPYRGASEFDTIQKHVVAPVPRLPQALADFQPLIDRMMAKSPDDRFASARELVGYLRELRSSMLPDHGDTLDLDLVATADGEAETLMPDPDTETKPFDDDGCESTTTRIELATSTQTVLPADATVRRRRAPVALAALVLVAVAAGGWKLVSKQREAREAHAAATVVSAPAASAPLPPDAGPGAGEAQPGSPAAGPGAAPEKSDAAPVVAAASEPTPQPRPAAAVTRGDGAGTPDPRVGTLLASADQALEDLRLTTPERNNALYFYQEVLSIEPSHPEALDGPRRIADRYASLARAALQRGDTSRAGRLVERGLGVQERNESLLALQQQVEAAAAPRRPAPTTTVQARAEPSGDGANRIQGETPEQLYRRIKGWFN